MSPHPSNTRGCPSPHNTDTKYYCSLHYVGWKKLGLCCLLHFQITSDAELLKLTSVIYLFSDLKDWSRMGDGERLCLSENHRKQIRTTGDDAKGRRMRRVWGLVKVTAGDLKTDERMSRAEANRNTAKISKDLQSHLLNGHTLSVHPNLHRAFPPNTSTVCCFSSEGYSGQSPVSSPCSLPWGGGVIYELMAVRGGELLVQQKHKRVTHAKDSRAVIPRVL